MNHKYVYMQIILHAKSEEKSGLRKKGNGNYYERHHILPKSLFPLWIKRKSNLVLLTAREHFFCHQLLVKIYPCSSMRYALFAFISRPNADYKISSKEFERIKNNLHQTPSSIEKRKRKMLGAVWYTNGVENSLTNHPKQGYWRGRTYVVSEETKKKLSIARKGKSPNRVYQVTEETKNKISQTLKGNKNCNKESVRQRHLGMLRWTNGKENMVCKNCPGEGWYRGITWHKKEKRKNYVAWNKGLKNPYSKETQIKRLETRKNRIAKMSIEERKERFGKGRRGKPAWNKGLKLKRLGETV